jgi:hypothetical protein
LPEIRAYTESELINSGGFMAEPNFYLYPNHQNFQPGKSHLEKAAVYRSHSGRISLTLLLALLVFWGAGYFYRLKQSEINLNANIFLCELNIGLNNYIIKYEFVFDGQRYENTEFLPRTALSPTVCSQGKIEVAFIPTSPQDAMTTISPYSSRAYFHAIILGLIGSTILIMVFVSFQQNRKERHKYAQLQKADTILSAEVIKTGYVDAGRNYTYHFADYRFYRADGTPITSQIRSNGRFIWPSQVQIGDTLSILYVDNETYCVL